VRDAAPSLNGSATARLYFYVDPVNDAPVPADVYFSVYVGLATRVAANGTDVDGEDPTSPIARASVVIASAPSYGEVRLLCMYKPFLDE